MQSLYNFIVEPIGGRYNNSTKIGDKELIVNTEVYNHQYVNRLAKVLSIPRATSTDIQVGDTVIVHFNVFRRWHNVRGQEKIVDRISKKTSTLLMTIRYFCTSVTKSGYVHAVIVLCNLLKTMIS